MLATKILALGMPTWRVDSVCMAEQVGASTDRRDRVRLASVRSSVGVSGVAGVLTAAAPGAATGAGSGPEHPASPAATSMIPTTDRPPHRIPQPAAGRSR